MKSTTSLSGRSIKSAAAIAMAAAALAGCARATVGSDVKPNGTWTRTVELHGPPPDKTGGLMPAAKIEDSFIIPGAPWTVTKETKDDGLLVTCKRSMQAGETLKRDVVCRTKSDGKYVEAAVNECSVKETSPGVYTYREVIHWVGPKPKTMVDMDAVKTLKTALPPALATDASVQRLADRVAREFVLTLMGPPDPLFTSILSQIMMNPDLALRKLSARIGDGLDKALVAEYGDKMTPDQRKSTIQKLVASAFKSTANKANVDPTKGPDKDNAAGTALTFSVRLPGKILSTNGEIDKLTNEVYWGMYPEAAALGQDIVLTATCQAR